MRRPTPPPTMRWCVGPAGVLYEQALVAMRGVLDAAGEQHWRRWIDEDLEAWRAEGTTGHHRSAYGGMGSFNDLYLSSQTEPDQIWLDTALATLRQIASSVAPFAEQQPDGVRQVPPGASTTSLAGVSVSACGRCTARFVTTESRLYAAAAGWCSWVIPELVQGQLGDLVAGRSQGDATSDDRAKYVSYVDEAVTAAGVLTAEYDSYATWFCPSCGHRQWRSTSVAVF